MKNSVISHVCRGLIQKEKSAMQIKNSCKCLAFPHHITTLPFFKPASLTDMCSNPTDPTSWSVSSKPHIFYTSGDTSVSKDTTLVLLNVGNVQNCERNYAGIKENMEYWV